MRPQAFRRLGLASLLGAVAALGATSAQADTANAACDAASLTCSVGTSALSAKITSQLPTVIDSGMMDKGQIKVRARFTIDPVKGGDPLLNVDMSKGALVQATWNEKGFVNLKTVTDQSAQGTMNVHYTLTPSLEASIYGIGVNYNAAQLINKIPGGKFNYDAKASMPMLPWGFAPTTLKGTPPALDQSTIFAIPFSDLGVSTSIVAGTLSVQAAANPTFTYTTKQVRLDSESVSKADGIAKLPVGDDDNFLEVNAQVSGEVQLGGTLDIRPVIKVDSVAGVPTFGLVKYSFTAVSKTIGGNAPVPVTFENTTIHIPLPNVKVPTSTLAMGDVPAGKSAMKTVVIDSTGELGGKMSFTSSDPQFTVPTGEVTVGAKGKYDLKVSFKPTSDAPASANITVKSNDPGTPEQTFRVAANGAPTNDPNENGPSGDGALEGPQESSGCSVASTGGSTGNASTYGLLGLGLGLAAFVRRRRSH